MDKVRKSIMRRGAAGDIEGHDPSKFALDQPTAVIKQGGGGAGDRPSTEAPEEDIEDFRQIADTDPHVNEAIDTLVDYLVGSGFSVVPANIPGTEEEQTEEDISDLKYLIETSTFETVIAEWVWHALVDGTGFLEVVVEDDVFKPKVLPTEMMEIETDEYGDVEQYIQHPPDGDEITFDPYDLAVLKFHKHPYEDFGHSILESAQEQADMLRDMEIDMARFIATKAYPPILWKLGSDERPWTQAQIDGWLEELEHIDPESQLAVGHDVEHSVVGVDSGDLGGGGAMGLDDTFQHLQDRIAAAIGVPSFLLNMGVDTNSGAAQVIMPKFDRRIQRYRSIIKESIRHQMFVSILAGDSDPEEFNDLPPEFEFGQHSSEEQRLEADTAIKLINNGLLTPEAAAKKLDIDPEVELPEIWQQGEFIEILQLLAGNGDDIQNPEGGSPTNTGGGSDSAGGEVVTREEPHTGDNENGRNQRDVSQE